MISFHSQCFSGISRVWFIRSTKVWKQKTIAKRALCILPYNDAIHDPVKSLLKRTKNHMLHEKNIRMLFDSLSMYKITNTLCIHFSSFSKLQLETKNYFCICINSCSYNRIDHNAIKPQTKLPLFPFLFWVEINMN